MSKVVSNRLIWFWEKGYLYITIASLMYFFWFISNNVGILDWVKEIAYFEYFKTSFNDYHTLPYFWWNILEDVAWRPPIPGTSALIANPETALFSPLTPLLYLFGAKVYIKLYIIIQFIVGVFGLFALKRKLNWGNSQFRTFVVLFLFSPIIIQHISVAYFTWYNFYLFPWLIYFVADRRAMVGIVGSAAVLGLIVLQGGIYIVQYIGLFYILYEIFHILFEKEWKRILRIIIIPLLAVLLALVRIYITGYAYGDYARPWVEINGYNIFFFLFYALIPTVTIPPLDLFFHSDYLGWSLTPHDSGQFWGLSIVMLALVITRYRKIVRNASSQQQNGLNYNAVFISASVLFIISFYQIWYLLMREISVLDIPLFESIKNHGIRFVMGAYFGYAILLANYSNSIWQELEKFVKTKLWLILKRVLLVVGYGIFLGSGLFFTVLSVFKKLITDKFAQIITAAYNNTGHHWLRQRMEGMQENPLEFYFYRFDIAYSSISHWIFVVLAISLSFFILAYLLSKNKNRTTLLIRRFPYLKYELLLAIPLAFSTGMWMNLATSVPFDKYPIRKVIPPEVVVELPNGEYLFDVEVDMEVTPKKILIKPEAEFEIISYIFLQIPATDYSHFDIVSKNAVLFDKNGQLMIKPFDDKPVEMQFRTEGVTKAIIITIVSWLVVIILMLAQLIVNRKNRLKTVING